MEGLLKEARESLEYYLNSKVIPLEHRLSSRDNLRGAQGIALITQIKSGLRFGDSEGTGIILYREKNGNWSGPCAIGMGGISWDFARDISKVNHIIILPTMHHLQRFIVNGNLQIRNAESYLADIGRDTNAEFGTSNNPPSSAISYSFSNNEFYGGLNIQGAVITVNDTCNEAFYEKKVAVEDITNGNIKKISKHNEDYNAIVRVLNDYCQPISTGLTNNNNANSNSQINEPIIREKPPLIRQNEVSYNTIAQHDVLNPTQHDNNDQNNNNK